METALVSDPLLLEHDTGPGHPERPDRVRAILKALSGLPLLRLQARDAEPDEILAAHDPGYVEALKRRIAAGERRLDADTTVGRASWPAAVRAAGAALTLGEAWLEGRIRAGFACIRPPGHHACRARAMGFCLLSNAAILALFLRSRGARAAIVDWDVHHGNGTEDVLRDVPDVLYASLHEHPLYPGTGLSSAGHIVNVPLPAGTREDEYLAAFDREVLPAVERHAPDVVLVSAGFDAHEDDPLANLRLRAESYAALTRRLARWPLLSLLEGGYDLAALAASARAHVEALLSPHG